MVKSQIDNTINFIEEKDMYPEDIEYSSALYLITIFDIDIAIVIGQMRTEKKGVVYYPIYIIADDNGEPVVKSQIGVFEVPEKESLSILDDDNNINLGKMGEPLFYSFVTEKFIKRVHSEPKKYSEIIVSDSPTIHQPTIHLPTTIHQPSETKDEKKDSRFSLNVIETREIKKINEVLKEGVFDKKPHVVIPPYLEEEIESTATSDYIESAKDPWIQKYMKNPHYDIHEVESNGDCLFATIRDAYKEQGLITTVSKLRAIVANELTEDIFSHHHEIYEMISNEKKRLEKEIKILKAEIEHPETKAKIKSEKKKDVRKKMLEDANAKVKMFNENVTEYQYTKKNLDEYKHMENIQTIEDYRKYILTSNYWADAWAIFILEQNLKMKMIIFGEEAFKSGDEDNVIHCGYSLEENKNSFTPLFYIMTTYSGNHYRLISYKSKKILTFGEIPYHTKILIVKKCMEGIAGIYNLIQDFRDFKSRLHVDEKEAIPMIGGSDVYDSEIVFTYHKNAHNDLVGKGVGEKIPPLAVGEYAHLANIENWRRKLDDSWEHSNLLRLDNKMWKSVEHYVLGAQYKKLYPDVYLKFSLDSKSDISDDLSLAKSSILSDGVIVDNQKMKAVKTDEENDVHREMAIRAKFTQNEDFKKLLCCTKLAILQKFIAGDVPTVDHVLMKIRKELSCL
jgi:hypothetical protein